MNTYPLAGELDEIRRNWGWFLVLGIALVVLGFIALGAVWLSTIASVLMFGWLLVFDGFFEIFTSFRARHSSGFLLNLCVGVLFAVGGVMIIGNPLASAAVLTLVLAALFLAGGLFRIISASRLQYRSWGWAVLE